MRFIWKQFVKINVHRKEQTGNVHRKEQTGNVHRKEQTGNVHRKEQTGNVLELPTVEIINVTQIRCANIITMEKATC